jgi:hypothetical protein
MASITPSKTLVLAAILSLVVASSAEAQVRRGRTEPTARRWAPIAVGVRFGYDEQARGEVFGGQLRIPIVRNGILELVPNADVIFTPQVKEYQYNLEAAWVPGGLQGGIVLGGGVGWRHARQGATGVSQSTLFGWVVSLGGKTSLGPIQLEALLKWVFLKDTDYRPNSASLGINYPLWTVGGPAGS